ncbi:MAG: PIG-L deacetylase family protein [Actinomycetes bacterium]
MKRDVVLALGAHPDDLEGGCGGTLAALAARGYEVHMVVVTDGWCGSYDLPGPEIAKIRLKEAAEAAAIAGAASFRHLGKHDQGSEVSIATRTELVSLIREVRATVLIGHPPFDYHPDHRNASNLLFEARSAAAVPNFTDRPPLDVTPHLAYFDAEQGLKFDPHIWIDISDTQSVKRRMLEAHVSQAKLMRDMYGEDLIEHVSRLGIFRGSQRGCSYAEAFRGCDTYPEPDGGIRFLIRALEGDGQK